MSYPAAGQADLGWRIGGPLGHSTVAEPQDLEGPCVDLRANELWVVVPTDAFLSRRAVSAAIVSIAAASCVRSKTNDLRF